MEIIDNRFSICIIIAKVPKQAMRSRCSLRGVYWIMMSTLFLFSCGSDSGLYQDSSASYNDSLVISRFADTSAERPAVDSGEVAVVADRQVVKIYVDASESMKGFVIPSKSTLYSNFIRHLLREMAIIFPEAGARKYYRFGGDIQPISESELERASYQNYFYNRGDTKLDRLFSSFVSTPADQLPAAYVIVTDGIQSDAGYDFTSVCAPIGQWLRRGRVGLQLFGIKSQFKGEVFSEINRRSGEKYRLGEYDSGDDTGKFRPFYALVFSVDPRVGDRISNMIQKYGFEPLSRSLFLSGDLLRGDLREVNFSSVRINGTPKPPRLMKQSKQAPVGYFQWNARNTETGYIRFWFPLKLANSQLGELFRGTQGCSLRVRVLDRNGQPVTRPYVLLESLRAKEVQGQLQLEGLLRIEDMSDGRPYYLCLELIPNDYTFTIPKWVEEWSVDSDNRLEYHNRTLYLDHLIAGMIANAPFRSQPLGKFFLCIR